MSNSLSLHPIHSHTPSAFWNVEQARHQRRPYTVAAFMMVFVPIAGVGALSAASFVVKGLIVALAITLAMVAYRRIGLPPVGSPHDDA